MGSMGNTLKAMPGKERFQHRAPMTVTGEHDPGMERAAKEIVEHGYRFATYDEKGIHG